MTPSKSDANQSRLAGEIMEELWKHRAFAVGKFELKSGRISPYYIDVRETGSHANGSDILRKIGAALSVLIEREFTQVNKVVGVAYAGIPLVTAMTIMGGMPSCYTRKEPKTYGQKGNFVEGKLLDGDRIVLVDDLVTTGESKVEGLECVKHQAKLEGIKIDVAGVACLFDREEGGVEYLRSIGLKLASLIPVTWGVGHLKERGLIGNADYKAILAYVSEHQRSRPQAQPL